MQGEKFYAVVAVNGNGNIMLQKARLYTLAQKELAENEASELMDFDNVKYKVYEAEFKEIEETK